MLEHVSLINCSVLLPFPSCHGLLPSPEATRPLYHCSPSCMSVQKCGDPRLLPCNIKREKLPILNTYLCRNGYNSDFCQRHHMGEPQRWLWWGGNSGLLQWMGIEGGSGVMAGLLYGACTITKMRLTFLWYILGRTRVYPLTNPRVPEGKKESFQRGD